MLEPRYSERKNLGVRRDSKLSDIDYGQCPSKPTTHPLNFYASGRIKQPISNCPNANRATTLTPFYTSEVHFNPEEWITRRRPWNIPKRLKKAFFVENWPPQSPSQVLDTSFDQDDLPHQVANRILHHGHEHTTSALPCLGRWCWQTKKWGTPSEPIFCPPQALGRECDHTFSEWMRGCEDWNSRISLQSVPGMGIGVLSKHRWRAEDVLGAYVGTLIPRQTDNTDYCHEIHIGPEFTGREAEVAYIDAEGCGNWTRFVNHSCINNAVFKEARVGSTRILALVATREIMPGDAVTVDYQADYFRARKCLCGETSCNYRQKKVPMQEVSVNIPQPRRKRKVTEPPRKSKGPKKAKR